MLTPRNFSGSSNSVVDKMSQDPISGNRLPIWDDNNRTQDVDFDFYIAKPGADGMAYATELDTIFSNPGAVRVSSNRLFDNEIRSVFDSAESFTHSLKFSEATDFASSNIRVGIDTNNLSVHPSGGVGTGLRGFAFTAGSLQDSAGNEVVTSAFNDTINDSAGNNIFATASEVGAMAFRPRLFYHEIGHSLGLDHPFANTSAGRVDDFNAIGFDLNDNKYTVMTSPGNPLLAESGYGFSAGYMALDIAMMQEYYGIGDNNMGNTTYNLTDGAQITDPKSNNAALDIDGADESRAELVQAYADAAKAGGVWEGMKAYATKVSEQLKSGRFDGGEESIGRAYKTIYDGEREVDASGKESIGNGGIDEISYAGSQQSAMINLNDAGLGNDKADAQYLDLQREIKGSGRWGEFNTEFQDEIDATVNDTTGGLRPDAYNAGGYFSKLYTTDAAGNVTATQDGGYSIANGVVIENASGGDAADTITGNEHDNVLNGNKGADALYGGHGNDTLNGGVGNDSLVAGRGNNTLDGGADFDTASYKDYYDPNVGVPITQGISFSITGHQTIVTKPLGGAIAGPLGASLETDTVENVERFEGTSRDDVFTVENLSGNLYISGGAGNDTLTVKDPTGAYSLDITGGTYPAGHERAGETYTGTVSNGTDTIYLEDRDLNVTIETPAPAVGKRAELGLENAIEILAEDQQTLNQHAEATGVSTSAHKAINHPDAEEMMLNLHAEGVSTLRVDIRPDMEAEERVGHILNAGKEATHEAGLLMPEEQRAADAQIDMASQQQIHSPERAYEEDYSYGL